MAMQPQGSGSKAPYPFRPGQRIHLVGIGGTGMSSIAEVLLAMGCRVSGSDLKASSTLERLQRAGVDVSVGHSAAHVDGAELVVVSSAVPATNPEVRDAKDRGIPVWHRSEALAQLINGRKAVAVAGAHGKTTITALTGHVMAECGLHPLVVVGAGFGPTGSGARYGEGPWAVAEADESDASFLRYRPTIAIVTSVDPDHLEHFGGEYLRLLEVYRSFLANVVPGGAAVLGVDDPRLAAMAGEPGLLHPSVQRRTYGLYGAADYTAREIELEGRGSRFVAVLRGRALGPVRLRIPGRHNVANALAVLATCQLAGLPFEQAAAAMESFEGARRRFEVVARDAGGVMVVDDYAHHPQEIRATLRAAREGYRRRIVAVFQPHRYSRTHFLFDQFATAFGDADLLVLAGIYAPPPEQPIPGVSGWALARRIEAEGNPPVRYCETLEETLESLKGLVRPGDLVITMGAGDVWKVAHRLAAHLAGSGCEPSPSGQASGRASAGGSPQHAGHAPGPSSGQPPAGEGGAGVAGGV